MYSEEEELMNFKLIGLSLGAIGLAVRATKSVRKTKRELANSWFYSSQFRDDLARKVRNDFKREHPNEELTDEIHINMFFEKLEKYRKNLI